MPGPQVLMQEWRVGHEMVRASAGTGKTTSLTRRYVKLLALGAAPESIVALTFTRKAAAEFFERIAKLLAEGAADDDGANRVAESLELPEELRGKGRRLFQELLKEFIAKQHLLSLGTLDSFFSRVVRSFPFELGVAGGFEVIDGYTLEVERSRSIRAVFDRIGQDSNRGLRLFLEAFKLATLGLEEVKLESVLINFVNDFHRLFLETPAGLEWGSAVSIWGHER